MLDLSIDKLLVIAVVALVVLGPERFPEVMRRAGQMYRQLRDMSGQLTSELQRQWEEGMQEPAGEISSSISSAWRNATGPTSPESPAQAALPPPRLRQVAPPHEAPATAAEAGPWLLAAWYRDTAVEREAEPADDLWSPFALPRSANSPQDSLIGGLAADLAAIGIDGRSLVGRPMGPTPAVEELARTDASQAAPALAGALPDTDVASGPPPPPTQTPDRLNGHFQPAEPLPHAVQSAASRQLASAPNGAGLASTGSGSSSGDDETAAAATLRQHTVIELYRHGGVTLDNAAQFLRITPAEFLHLLKAS